MSTKTRTTKMGNRFVGEGLQAPEGWKKPDYLLKKKKTESRSADCGREEGGRFGEDNKCQAEGSGGSAKEPNPRHAAMEASHPKSFPKGTAKFRDAVDRVAPDPEKVWDRSKGKAPTPPQKVLDEAANEQETNGKELTPEAEAAYKDLVDEIGRQYESLLEAGLKVSAWKGDGEPYGDPPGSTKPNSDKMREEVARTGEFKFFMTEKGFGTGDFTPDHPMMRETKYKTADGDPMIANDLFRVVHDLVAHVRGGYSFSTNGEYNGMLTHASTLPESAWPALFAETFGQNAVYEKTGGYAQQNAYASKVGPKIIKEELAKRKKESRAEDKGDSDEPLGFQHMKVRPWLRKQHAEKRMQELRKFLEARGVDCGRDESGRFGPKNQCQDEGNPAFKPVGETKNSDFAKVRSHEETKAALAKNKAAKYLAHESTVSDGERVALRIDIPAFENHGVYAITVHKPTGQKTVGSPLGYTNIARLTGGVEFVSNEDGADDINAGEKDKFPIATVKGSISYDSSVPVDIDEWTAVGYNPKKAAFFYDKKTGLEVTAGTDAISLGNTVFVRKPEYGKRNAKVQRRAFCPTGEGGGVKNDCSSDEGGGFPKPKSVRVSGEKPVADSLSKTGVTQEQAIAVTGAPNGADVWIRPANEFGPDAVMVLSEFKGMETSSIIMRDGDKKVIQHNLFDALPGTIDTDRGKIAAAREFFKVMATSIERARKAGFDELRFSADGDKGHPLKGYTIWPRMGFDAPIPEKVLKKGLPDGLKNAKTLLDLHETPEGTRFWAENGAPVDMKLDLKDRSSRQAKAIDEFIGKIRKNKRSFDLFLADFWLDGWKS